MLVGRESECAQIDSLLADAGAGRSGALVLVGDPGIGKSALCEWALAQGDGMGVLSARGVESEADLPFAGLAELCAGELDRLDLLPEPQARALEGALARRATPSNDRFAIGAAVLSLLAVAARGGSALVVVDDAQWLDASSADALLFAARRLRSEGVAMLVSTRPGAIFEQEHSGLSRLVLRGLTPPAAHALLEAAHGALPDHVARLLAERTQCNPLALLEVPRLLSAAQLTGERPIDEPLPVGPTLERALLRRVSGLPDEARRALLVAAASDAERIDPVVDALGALGLDRGVLDEAEHVGVLTIVGERFEFRHPLLRSAIYHGAGGPARRAAHAALAAVTGGEPGAWHLAQATVGEDEAVAATLERFGLDARRRGAPAAAAAALERAGRLSEPGAGRVRRLTEAARDAYVAGRPAGALRLLDEALADPPDAVQRADIEHVRGRILVLQGRFGAAHRPLVDAADLVRDVDPERAAAMLAEAGIDCIGSLDIRSAITTARDAYNVARQASPGAQTFAGSMLASALTLNGDRAEANALLDRVLPLLRGADPLTEAGRPVFLAAQSYSWLERYELASELLDRLIASARQASAPAALPIPLTCRADLDWRLGRWKVAAAEAEEAVLLSEEMAQPAITAYALECLARLAAAGDERRCRDHAAHAMRLAAERHSDIGRFYVHSALGLLELGLGRIEAAIRQLESARGLAERHGLAEPNVVHWQADLIEAYVRAGQPGAARDVLNGFQPQAERTGGRWALGTAARCEGLLADETEQGVWFAAALEQLESLPSPFEVARTHLCHGERLRRAGRRRDARKALYLAIEGFDQLGAEPWANRAQTELRATGATPRRRRSDPDPDQLTAHELRVALIVAGGASNREAAAALFLSPKTIEFHLARVYRKLGLRTRSELVAVAARRGWLDGGAPHPGPDAARQARSF